MNNPDSDDIGPNHPFHSLRPLDHDILRGIADGHRTVTAIVDNVAIPGETRAKQRRKANYSLKHKLADGGFIKIRTPESYTTTTRNGQQRTHRRPKEVALTGLAVQYFDWSNAEDRSQYESLSHDDLTRLVYNLDRRVEQLEQYVEAIRKQVLQKFDKLEGER